MTPGSRFTLAVSFALLTGGLFPLLHYALALEAGTWGALAACIWLALLVSGWTHSLGRSSGCAAALGVMLLPLPAVVLLESPLVVMLQSGAALFLARRLMRPRPAGLLPWLAEALLVAGGGGLCLWLAPHAAPAPLTRDSLAWGAAISFFLLLQCLLLVPLAGRPRPRDEFEYHRRRAERLLEMGGMGGGA